MRKELDWQVTITDASNGFLVSYKTHLDNENEDIIKTEREVFEDTEGDRLKAMESVLWFLIDYFGTGGSRYDKERLTILREAGDKYEGTKN